MRRGGQRRFAGASSIPCSCPRYEGAKPLTRRPLVLPEVRKSAAWDIGFLVGTLASFVVAIVIAESECYVEYAFAEEDDDATRRDGNLLSAVLVAAGG
jgi:hypothetical protein